MNQTKISNRFVVIAGTTRACERPGYRETNELRLTARRIVVIKNGKSVGSRRSRSFFRDACIVKPS
jgi:hypothetical protein